MKLLRNFCTILILLTLILLITGCVENRTTPKEDDLKIEGYILEVDEGRILLAEGMTSEQYETLKDTTFQELDNQSISLFYLSFEDTSRLRKGDKVDVWIDGGIDLSDPAQAGAKKIEVTK